MKKTPALFYKLYFLFIFIGYLIGFAFYQPIAPDLFWGFSTVVSPAIELGFFCMCGHYIVCVGRNWLRVPAMIISLLIPLCLALVYLSQGYSAILSGSYITVLALENAGETQYVLGWRIILVGALVIISWLGLAGISVWHSISRPKVCIWKTGWIGAVSLSLLFVLVLDGKTRPYDLLYLTPDVVPATSLLRTANELREARGSMDQKVESIVEFDFPEAVPVNLDAAYPLQRRQHEFPPLPFKEIRRPNTPLNVIVIFAEGMSARVMETYSGRYTDLTPNLNSFAQSAMVVDNYYNHTAATFRGLLGQLASGHPFYGGSTKDGWEEKGKDNTGALSKFNYQTLPNILRENGYDTAFFHRTLTPIP